MTPHDVALLAGAGFLAGICNAVAGGGSLISFPALLATGLPPVTANVTNALGVWPGYLGGAFAYRGRLKGHGRRLRAVMAAAALGAIGGTLLLLVLPAAVFQAVVPYLVLGATTLFAAQPRINRLLAKAAARREPAVPETVQVGGGVATTSTDAKEGAVAPEWAGRSFPLLAGVFLAGLYGAYFAGGLGIILLTVLLLTTSAEMQFQQGAKTVLQLLVSTVATIGFAAFGPVHWVSVLVLGPACLLGGNLGGRLSRRLHPTALRVAVTVFGLVIGIRMLVSGS
ncbi:sulfite exporter TauE/SafE family protein [Spirillospora sp. NPDC047279]|uniref:sulfite exporter TauE/SafE family protein n=1 Tax=Spirillospora sp. NPDC047279 TaxID=3155478 RepID=UPI0033DC9B53